MDPVKYYYRSGNPVTDKRLYDTKHDHTKTVMVHHHCTRCGGQGGGVQWKFTGWTCYKCGGTGQGDIKATKVYTAEKLAKLDAAKAKRDAKRQKKYEAEQAQAAAEAAVKLSDFTQAHKPQVDWLTAHRRDSEFMTSIYTKLTDWGTLTDCQLGIIQKEMDKPQATDVIEGRIVITGEIVSLKSQPGYAYGSTDWKMIVLDDRGFKVWGTHPTALSETGRGDRVTFTAAVTRSDKDSTFGFFKRPTKARQV